VIVCDETAQRAAEKDNPLLETLGIRQRTWQPGLAAFSLAVEPRHLNRRGSLQGGVIATLLDVACGYAGLQTELGMPPGTAVTIMLNISYLANVKDGTVTARGRVTGGGRRIYFAAAEVVTEAGTLIATAQGTFKRTGVPAR
jgi:uncharacterized protein (TIGR00369 family)